MCQNRGSTDQNFEATGLTSRDLTGFFQRFYEVVKNSRVYQLKLLDSIF